MSAGAARRLIAATLLVVALGGCGSAGDSTSTADAGAGSATGAAGSSSTPSGPSQPAPVRRPAHRPRPAPAAGLGRRTRTSGCHVRGQLPDPACTPGAVFAAATVAQICTPGYASSVRNVPESLKRTVYADYGTDPSGPGSYEVDHLVPLELGGSNQIANLWPEIAPGYQEKDQVENELHDALCAGQIGLAVAQQTIARDWRRAGVPRRRRGRRLPGPRPVPDPGRREPKGQAPPRTPATRRSAPRTAASPTSRTVTAPSCSARTGCGAIPAVAPASAIATAARAD